MFNPVLEGILLGLTLAVLMGPVFFSLLQTSMHRGFWSGMFLALGVIISDLTLVFLSYIGLSKIISQDQNQLIFGIAGGIVLIVFGIITFRRRVRFRDMRMKQDMLNTSRAIKYVGKGYILNIANPFIWIFWIGVMSVVHSNYSHSKFYMMVFFTSALGTVLVTDLLKCYGAHKIKRLLRPRTLLWINRVVGIMLALFGLILMIRVTLFPDFTINH